MLYFVFGENGRKVSRRDGPGSKLYHDGPPIRRPWLRKLVLSRLLVLVAAHAVGRVIPCESRVRMVVIRTPAIGLKQSSTTAASQSLIRKIGKGSTNSRCSPRV